MGFGVPLRTPSYILGYHPLNRPDAERPTRKWSYKNKSDRKRRDDDSR
jgi:hypothetical protein